VPSKNLFELWNDKELPESIQEKVDGFATAPIKNITIAEQIFRAGFWCGKNIKRIFEAQGKEYDFAE
jgi:hypothetical protein